MFFSRRISAILLPRTTSSITFTTLFCFSKHNNTLLCFVSQHICFVILNIIILIHCVWYIETFSIDLGGGTMKNTEELGRKIQELRLKNDLSLRNLSERSGVSYSFISSIEKNRFNGSRQTIIALADALNGADKNELLLLAGYSPENDIIADQDVLYDPDVQFIARAKKEMSPKDFQHLMELAKKAKEMFDDEE